MSNILSTSYRERILASEKYVDEAIDLYEYANQLLIEAGQLLAQAKAVAKKGFRKRVEAKGFKVEQINKLIKASVVAEKLSPTTVANLGVDELVKLGRKSNEQALDAIAQHDVTQIQAQAIIEEFKPVPEPKEPSHQFRWKRNKDGTRSFIIELPDCQTAIDIEQQWKANPLPSPLFLKQLLDKDKPQSIEESPASVTDVLQAQISEVKQRLSLYSNPSDATEMMMYNRAKQELEMLQRQLNKDI